MKRLLSLTVAALFATTTYAHELHDVESMGAAPAVCLGNDTVRVCINRSSVLGSDEHPKRRTALISYRHRSIENATLVIFLHVCNTHTAHVKLVGQEAFEELLLGEQGNEIDHEVARFLCMLRPAQLTR